MIFLRQLIFLRPKNFLGTKICKDVPNFLFFDHEDVLDFLEFLLNLFFFFSLLPLFFQNFGAPFHLGALGNGLIGLVEGSVTDLHIISVEQIVVLDIRKIQLSYTIIMSFNCETELHIISVEQRVRAQILYDITNTDIHTHKKKKKNTHTHTHTPSKSSRFETKPTDTKKKGSVAQ